jgi:hypothetical protein
MIFTSLSSGSFFLFFSFLFFNNFLSYSYLMSIESLPQDAVSKLGDRQIYEGLHTEKKRKEEENINENNDLKLIESNEEVHTTKHENNENTNIQSDVTPPQQHTENEKEVKFRVGSGVNGLTASDIKSLKHSTNSHKHVLFDIHDVPQDVDMDREEVLKIRRNEGACRYISIYL